MLVLRVLRDGCSEKGKTYVITLCKLPEDDVIWVAGWADFDLGAAHAIGWIRDRVGEGAGAVG